VRQACNRDAAGYAVLRLRRAHRLRDRNRRPAARTRRLDWLFTVPEADLRNGTLDLAIGYFPDARYLAPDLVMEPLSEENNVVIARRGHTLWKGKLTSTGLPDWTMPQSFTAIKSGG